MANSVYILADSCNCFSIEITGFCILFVLGSGTAIVPVTTTTSLPSSDPLVPPSLQAQFSISDDDDSSSSFGSSQAATLSSSLVAPTPTLPSQASTTAAAAVVSTAAPPAALSSAPAPPPLHTSASGLAMTSAPFTTSHNLPPASSLNNAKCK